MYDCNKYKVQSHECNSNTPHSWLSSESLSDTIPAFSCRTQNRCWARPLVSMSATILCVGQYFSSIVPLLTCSLTKWCFTSMCLALPWNFGFLAIAMDAWLSSRIVVGLSGGFPSSELSCLIQTHSCVALDKATYSASAVVLFKQLIKGTNITSPCTRPCVFLLAFLETNPCPTLYPIPLFLETIKESRYSTFPDPPLKRKGGSGKYCTMG